MSLERKIAQREKRRKFRVRSSFKRTDLPRISVFRSAKHIYGQLINDVENKTIVSYSTLQAESELKGDKKQIAHQVGLELAKRALEQGIKEVGFDRGPFLYHGRVQAFADGLREGGLKI